MRPQSAMSPRDATYTGRGGGSQPPSVSGSRSSLSSIDTNSRTVTPAPPPPVSQRTRLVTADNQETFPETPTKPNNADLTVSADKNDSRIKVIKETSPISATPTFRLRTTSKEEGFVYQC